MNYIISPQVGAGRNSWSDSGHVSCICAVAWWTPDTQGSIYKVQGEETRESRL